MNRFFIDNLPVLFPYEKIYPGKFDLLRINTLIATEQYAYMCSLKATLDAGVGFCL